MAWFAVIRDSDGELVSVGTVVADPLPAGLVALALPEQPDGGAVVWDRLARVFVARPAPAPLLDRIEEVVGDVALAGILTNQTRRDTLRAVLANHFPADTRFYRPEV